MRLQTYNAFGLDARADQGIILEQATDLKRLTSPLKDEPRVILGAGSNVIIHAPIRATVLINRLKGRSINADGLLSCAAGEDWHELVVWSLAQGYAGLENLALIPGTAGAAPVQNIGAYGVELSDRFISLKAWDIQTQSECIFSKADCQFGYRDSFFKRPEQQGPWDQPRFLITEITLQLQPMNKAQLVTDYAELQSMGPFESAAAVAKAVIEIRQSKLPDPSELGNVGSFFKNPIVSGLQARHLKLLHPDLPLYPVLNNHDTAQKISAAWLIDRCGFKGARRGDVGVYDRHALVLVNHGGGTGREVLALAQEIQQAVVARFGIFLEPEPSFMPPV